MINKLRTNGLAFCRESFPAFLFIILLFSSNSVLSAVFQQGPAPDGVLSMEAEDYSQNVAQGGHAWTAVSPAGYSGSGALEATPNSGVNVDNNVSNSPRLDYSVNFLQAGTYSVWVRGIGATGNDDSVNVGLDGVAQTTSDRIT